jgi:hypothetical protein
MQPDLPLDLPLLDGTTCKWCEQVTINPVVVTKHFGTTTKQLYFCCEECSREYYMHELRRTAL